MKSTTMEPDIHLTAHEKVCAERYGNINQQLTMLRAQLGAQATDFHARFNTLSNRMWAAACGMILLSVGGLSSLLLVMLTRR